MEDLSKAIIALLHDRGLAGEGMVGSGIQDHSVYGEPVAMGTGKPKAKRTRKKKVAECDEAKVGEPIDAPLGKDDPVKELLAGGKKKKRVVSAEGRAKLKKAAAGNPWLMHLAAFRKAHPDVKGKDVTKQAKASYKKK